MVKVQVLASVLELELVLVLAVLVLEIFVLLELILLNPLGMSLFRNRNKVTTKTSIRFRIGLLRYRFHCN